MIEFLSNYYLWIKSIHIMAVISWMAGIFYLPRLFVYHVEEGLTKNEFSSIFQIMEKKLLAVIMTPAMVVTWIFGILLALIPGVIDWEMIWPWAKLTSILGMTWFHFWLSFQRKKFETGENVLSGRGYRMMNEVPTILMVFIVISVVVKPF